MVRARVLTADGELRARFEEEFPDTFGGTFTDYEDNDEKKPITVYQTVGAPGALPDIIRSVYSAITSDTTLWPKLRFDQVQYSLHALHQAQIRVHGDAPSLADEGIAITMTGINDQTNSVVVAVAPQVVAAPKDESKAVTSSVDLSAASDVLHARYKAGPPLDIREMGKGANQDRFGDTPPWNGGDLILANNPQGQACSTGFGMVGNNTHNSYIVTAGHCTDAQPPFNTYAWKNTYPVAPLQVTGADTVGVVSQSTGANQIDDYAYIQTPSSNLIWKGIALREYVLGPKVPKAGDLSCREGAITIYYGGNQQCGNIDVVDAWPQSINTWQGVTANRFFVPQAPGNGGDSGGPWVFPMSTGVMAQGIIVAGYGPGDCGSCDPQNHGEGESIPYIAAHSQATLRTYSNPNPTP